MLAWTSWLRFSSSGSAAEKLSSKTRSGYSPNSQFGFQFYWKRKHFFNSFYSVVVSSPMCFSPLVSFNIRCQMRSLVCSFPSRGPPCHRPRLTQKRGFIEGWMSPLGYVTSTRTDRWRRSISCARYVCRCEHKQAIIILRNQSERNQSANMLSSVIPIHTVSITFSGSTCFGKSF